MDLTRRKDSVIAVIVTFCIAAILFSAIQTWSSPGVHDYNPWYDVNNDGKIDGKDIALPNLVFGTAGQNITKSSIQYDSGWINITDKCGQYFNITHSLNSANTVVDITGKTTLDGPVQRFPGWSRCPSTWTAHDYGGPLDDVAESVVQTSDGGYALAGFTQNATGDSFWLVKTDTSGNLLWNNTYRRKGFEQAYSVVQNSIYGGYALAGITADNTTSKYDAWWVWTDTNGKAVFNKTYGGIGDDLVYGMIQTSDGGYALAGLTNSYGAGDYDAWLIRINALGNMMWNKTYGATGFDDAYSVVQTSDGGFALTGYTDSTGNVDAWLVRTDASGNMLWNKTYGGTNLDWAISVIQTSDGGYALGGTTNSFSASHNNDFWLVKTDASGNMLWNRTYGGSGVEEATSVVQTSDGGYALAGFSDSNSPGIPDMWLVKTDISGNALWNHIYGGTDDDRANSMVQARNGEYALAGFTKSFGAGKADFWLVIVHESGSPNTSGWSKTFTGTSDVVAFSVVQTRDGGYALAGFSRPVPGPENAWLTKTDASGTLMWNQTYGGTGYDGAQSMIQTNDGGYALAGYTTSYGAESVDFWLVKTDASGKALWNHTYGGTGYDWAYSVIQTNDGGYALAGSTNSSGAGLKDYWLVKTDASGNMLWNKTYGMSGNDVADSLIQTNDGGYALAGWTDSIGGYAYAAWLVKTNATGDVIWSGTYGAGAGDNTPFSVIQTNDGGYALAGYTTSSGAGGSDMWLVKARADGWFLWNKTYGGLNGDAAYSLIQTNDGGYALAGGTYSFGTNGSCDFWLVKTDLSGNTLWNETYGGTGYEAAYSLVQSGDGSYVLAGSTNSFGATADEAYLVKTDTESGVFWAYSDSYTMTLYRGATDPYWNFVRVRVWQIQNP